MKTSATGIELIQSFEDCARARSDGRFEAYPDPKTGGAPWTIGWGTTGPDIKPGLIWTQAQCDAAFARKLTEVERDVLSLVKVPLTQGQFDAVVSFTYNCGPDIDADTKAEGLGDSTLLKLLNAGKYDDACGQFALWISKGSKAENGLRRRRACEMALFRS